MGKPLSYQTAGESHGPALVAIVDGLPADLAIDAARVNGELARRQGGYGRGARQKMESDVAEFLGGLRQGRTIGSPVALRIINKDSRIDDPAKTPPVTRPRPGHADLAGSLKYLTPDCRGTLERASARETAARVAAGAVARCVLDAPEVALLAKAATVEGGKLAAATASAEGEAPQTVAQRAAAAARP